MVICVLIPAFRRQTDFEAILVYTVRPCLKRKKKKDWLGMTVHSFNPCI